MQQSATTELYKLEGKVKATKDQRILADWRKLQTSDHFYYMCTKWFSDGDVHKYFNPYDSPYEAYMNFMNALDNLNSRCNRALRLVGATRLGGAPSRSREAKAGAVQKDQESAPIPIQEQAKKIPGRPASSRAKNVKLKANSE